MDLIDKLFWMTVGGIIGFILGYIVRSLRELKEELDDVERRIRDRLTDESGLVRHPLILDGVLLIVVALTVWASFASQQTSNDVRETQDNIENVVYCNQQYLEAQAKFLSVYLEIPPVTDKVKREELEKYVRVLQKYIATSNLSGAPDNTFRKLPACEKIGE